MELALWALAFVLIAIGIAGIVLPAIPGHPLIFAGVLLAAWIDDFERIGAMTLSVLGVLTVVGVVIDYVAAALTARRAGASRQGVIGAAIGTVAGVFSGLWGLLFMPLVGAAVGELLARRDMLTAGRIGMATWIGLLIGAALKLAIAFAMVGVFVAALLW